MDTPSNNWTVKSVDPTVRRLAVEAANREDISVARWLEAAVRNQVSAANGVVVPPAPPANRELAAILADIATLAASGVRVPRDVGSHAFALIRGELRQMRGLAPTANRVPARSVVVVEGPARDE